MKTIQVSGYNPYFNLALEEYLLKEKDISDDLFFLWQNSPCIVIGRNQNPFNEIHLITAQEKGIPILRRISGGGTVFHDLGNINFTYITRKLKHRLNNYQFFLQPIIDVLQKVGIPARFAPSSHIYIGDKKISGNAQSFYKDRMIHHGTLLFDGDLKTLTQLLKPNKQYDTHTVDSTRAHTTNIKEQLPIDTDVKSFQSFLLGELLFDDITTSSIELTEEDITAIKILADTKYKSWKWTFGETPGFQVNTTVDGEVIQLQIEQGIIQESSLFPDELEGVKFLPSAIKEALPDSYDPSKLLEILF
jgi:lipoate-protein ligase A